MRHTVGWVRARQGDVGHRRRSASRATKGQTRITRVLEPLGPLGMERRYTPGAVDNNNSASQNNQNQADVCPEANVVRLAVSLIGWDKVSR